jgi:hypothetical protein
VGHDDAHLLSATVQVADGLWTILDIEGIKPSNNPADRALRHLVIQRKISHGAQLASGAICSSRLLTVTTILRQHRAAMPGSSWINPGSPITAVV